MILRFVRILIINFGVQSQIPTSRRELTPQEKRGKAFYLRGESASGQEITALMGEIEPGQGARIEEDIRTSLRAGAAQQ